MFSSSFPSPMHVVTWLAALLSILYIKNNVSKLIVTDNEKKRNYTYHWHRPNENMSNDVFLASFPSPMHVVTWLAALAALLSMF